MKKSRQIIISYIVSLVMIVIVYYFSIDLLISIFLGGILFLVINFYIFPKIEKTIKYRKSLTLFSHFANSLIMQLTVTPNVSSSLNEISSFLDEKQRTILQNDELLVKEKLDSIESNYNFPLYQVFKEVINLYDTQGGNIIDMSMKLLTQIDNYIKNVEEIALDNNKKISEIIVLWCFSLVALFYIKHVLYNYYVEVINEQNFRLTIGFFFLMLVFSVFIIGKKYIEIKLGD